MNKARKCPFCSGSPKFLFKASDPLSVKNEKLSIVRCTRCDLVYLGEEFPLDEIRSFYPEDYYAFRTTAGARRKKDKETIRKKIHHYILAQWLGYPLKAQIPFIFYPVAFWKRKKLLFRYPPFVPNGKLLDVGCGAGDFLLQMKELGWQVYGVEPSRIAVDHARTLGLDVHHGTLEDIDWPDSFFDVVRFSHVLEHVPTPIRTLQEAKRILRPGGIIMITVPNWNSLTAQLFRAYWYHLDPPRHMVWFTPKTLMQHAEAVKLSVLQMRTEPDYSDFSDSLIYALRESLPRLAKIIQKRGKMWKTINKLSFPVRLAMQLTDRGSVIHAIFYKARHTDEEAFSQYHHSNSQSN